MYLDEYYRDTLNGDIGMVTVCITLSGQAKPGMAKQANQTITSNETYINNPPLSSLFDLLAIFYLPEVLYKGKKLAKKTFLKSHQLPLSRVTSFLSLV